MYDNKYLPLFKSNLLSPQAKKLICFDWIHYKKTSFLKESSLSFFEGIKDKCFLFKYVCLVQCNQLATKTEGKLFDLKINTKIPHPFESSTKGKLFVFYVPLRKLVWFENKWGNLEIPKGKEAFFIHMKQKQKMLFKANWMKCSSSTLFEQNSLTYSLDECK